MKKIYFLAFLMGLCLLLSRTTAHAQLLTEETPWSHLVDSLTAPLDKSRITSGILYDRALPLASLHSFETRPDTTSINSSTYMRQAYLELWMAAYNRNQFRLTPDQYSESADRMVRQDSVPLSVLDYQFNWLDTLAVQDGLLSVQDGVLHEVASPSRSPYLLRNLVLASPLLDTLRQYTTTFALPKNLLLSNRGRKITGVFVVFKDGGPFSILSPGQSVSVTFSSNGRKPVGFIVGFSDGSIQTVFSSIYVKAPTTVANRSIPVTLANLGIVEARIPFQDYNSTTSLFGLGDVLAVLHNPTTQSDFLSTGQVRLRRPVIIIDGFDPNDNSALFENRSQKPEDLSVYNLLSKQGILKLLDDNGLQRDLIILNFPKSRRRTASGAETTEDVDGGADYIERNAFVLVELINRLKPLLETDPATGQPYQFAIIGPSMGGLVSRYALAYMEKQQAIAAPPPAGQTPDYWEHNTATWLSFDAPHQGAVVPMGDQAYLQFFQGLSDAARESLKTSLNSPAAKQMLVHHVLAPGNTPAGAPGFRDRFMLALRDNGLPGSLGYPVHLRRVALANGRLDGKGDPGGTPCGKMFDMDIRLRTGYAIGTTVLSTLLYPIIRTIPPIQIAACTARFAPAPGTSCPVFEGVLRYGIYGYSPIGVGGAYISPIYGRRVVNSGGQGSFDLAPGGLRRTQGILKEQAEAGGRTPGGRELGFKVQVTNVAPNHGFIPTVSALGFQYQSMSGYQNTGSLPDSYTNLLTRSLVCNNETPFDDFYAPPAANSEHVTVPDAAALAFLIRELTPRVATPVFTAAPKAICPDGGKAEFKVAPECPRPGQPAIIYTWTADPSLQIVSGQGTATVTVQSSSGGVGAPTLQVVATRAGYLPSAAVAVYVPITLGFIDTELDLQGSQKVCPNSTVIVRVISTNAQPPYYWTETSYRNGLPQFTSSFTTQDPFYQVGVGEEQVELTVTAQDICTGQNLAEAPRTITPYKDPDGGFFCDPNSPRVARESKPVAYPNPANSVLNLAAPEAADIGTPRTAVLYNTQGREVKRTYTSESRLSTVDLPAGLYYLLVEQNGHVTRSQIRVQH